MDPHQRASIGQVSKRKRAYIPLPERLAAALAMLLPADLRDVMREDRLPAKAVLQLFQFDHGVLHAHGGADKWWNLTPMTFAKHREKSRRDTSIVAKVDRIIAREKKHKEARNILLLHEIRTPIELVRPKRAWPKRKIVSSPFRRLAK